jgi:hypothetical protein
MRLEKWGPPRKEGFAFKTDDSRSCRTSYHPIEIIPLTNQHLTEKNLPSSIISCFYPVKLQVHHRREGASSL